MKRKKKNFLLLWRNGNVKTKRILVGLYHILRKNWITKRYISDIRHIFEILKPSNEIEIISQTMKLFLKGLFISIIILFFSLSFKGTTIYNYIIIFSVIFLLNSQVIQINLEKEERKLLKQFEKYLGDVRHFFHKTGMVEEAIFDSLEEAEYEIHLHMGKIHELLVDNNVEDFQQYKEIAPNKFFVTFLALCQITIQYGDTIKNQESLFLSNLNHLKNEVNVELLKRERISYVFSGLLFTTILPVFFLKVIETWSISNLPELERYYYGTYGIIVSIIIFLATLISYQLISRLKGMSHIYEKNHVILEKLSQVPLIKEKIQIWIYKHAKKAYQWNQLIRKSGEKIKLSELLIKRVLIFSFVICSGIVILIQLNYISKYNSLNYTKDFQGTSFLAGNTLEDARDSIQILANAVRKEKKEEERRKQVEEGLDILTKGKTGFQGEHKTILIEEILKRVEQYQNSKLHWYYFLAIILIGFISSWIPIFILECKRYFIRMSMEDEVLQFHSIIIMLMSIGRMNAYIILEWMENFGEIFKDSLMECVDLFSYDEEAALESLKEKEPFLPFVRIIENIQACDSVGVEAAFDEIIGQRNYYMEKRKQENEIIITNKGVIGKVIAYIPLVLTLGLYLIIPFVLESITQLMGYVDQLSIS